MGRCFFIVYWFLSVCENIDYIRFLRYNIIYFSSVHRAAYIEEARICEV
ncbi:hypothetical protein HMPREF3033_00386 [Veillonellaceae bacterium DNF00751]|nr:hypothetical protein HMPREF3033_00386 [Veillonellaceae bacterium DNF00751]